MLPSGVGAQVQMQREGLYPQREKPVGTHHPANVNDEHGAAQLEDLKRTIQSRFASVSTPANFLQAGLFNAMGNNPVTQMVSAAGGAAGDIWSSLMNGPEQTAKNKLGKAKDPLTALNQHTKLLDEMLDSLLGVEDTVKAMWEKGTGLMGSGGDKPGPRSGKHVKQSDGEELKPRELKNVDYRTTAQKKAEEARKQEEQADRLDRLNGLKESREKISGQLESATTPEEKEQLGKQLKGADAAIESLERLADKFEKATGQKVEPKSTEQADLEKQLKGTNAAIESLARQAEKGSADAAAMLEEMKQSRDDLVEQLKQFEDEKKPSLQAEHQVEKFDPDKTINVPASSLVPEAPKPTSAPAPSEPKRINPDERINMSRDDFERSITKEQHENATKPEPITPAVDAKPFVPNMDAPTAANSTKFDPDKTINTTVDQLERDATKEVANKNKPQDPDARVAIGPEEAAKMREQALGGEKKPEKGFITQLFDGLGFKKASSVMESFTKTMQKASGELSKSFGEVSKTVVKKSKPLTDAMKGSETAKYLGIGKNALSQKAAPLLKAIKGSETAKYIKQGSDKTKEIAQRVLQGAQGVPAAIAQGKAPEMVGPKSPVEQAIADSGVTPNSSLLGDAVDVAEDALAAKSIWSGTKALGGKLASGARSAAGWLGKGASAAKNFVGSNAGVLGKAAAVAGAGFAGYHVAEEAQGKHVENVGDVVPEGWNKLNPFDWVQRGARYAGNKFNKGYEAVSGASVGSDIYDLFNKDPMKEMNAQAAAEKTKPAAMEPVKGPSRADAISATKEAVDDAKSRPVESAPETVIGSVKNTTNNNTTVLPSRQSITDNDDSFKRYVGRSYT